MPNEVLIGDLDLLASCSGIDGVSITEFPSLFMALISASIRASALAAGSLTLPLASPTSTHPLNESYPDDPESCWVRVGGGGGGVNVSSRLKPEGLENTVGIG